VFLLFCPRKVLLLSWRLSLPPFLPQAMEIENGVYLGPVGYLTFTGPFSFKARRLSFQFYTLTLKLGPLPNSR